MFQSVSRKFQKSFKEVSRKKGNLKVVPSKCLGCIKDVSRGFQGRFKDVSSKIEECFNGVLSVGV